MDFVDPFKADTSKYRQLLERDSSKSKGLDYDDYEEVKSDGQDDLLDRSTVKGLPPSVFKAARAAQEKLALNKEKKQQVAEAFNNLFNDLNKKYGLNVHLDFDSFNNTLSYIIEPTNKKAMEYYVSEAYGRFRVVIYSMYLQSIALLSAQILDPAYLLSESMTYSEKLDTMAKLYEFLQHIEEIYEKVNIPDTDLKLEKLTIDRRDTYNINDPAIQEYMANVFGKVKETKAIDK